MNALRPPQRAPLPLWLALLLKRQKRADIVIPPWLLPEALQQILELETIDYTNTFSPGPQFLTPEDSTGRPFHSSPPFLPSSTEFASPDALPYHWLEIGQILLDCAADDITEQDKVRQLLRDIREVRAAKLRSSIEALSGDAGGINVNGIGAMEIGQSRGFILGVVDGLRKLGASREQAQGEERDEGNYGQDAEEDMQY